MIYSCSLKPLFSSPEPRIFCLRLTRASGKIYVRENAPWGCYSQKLAIWTLRSLFTPRANMIVPIRDAIHCSLQKPIKRHLVSGFPRALLSVSHGQKRRALGSKLVKEFFDILRFSLIVRRWGQRQESGWYVNILHIQAEYLIFRKWPHHATKAPNRVWHRSQSNLELQGIQRYKIYLLMNQ